MGKGQKRTVQIDVTFRTVNELGAVIDGPGGRTRTIITKDAADVIRYVINTQAGFQLAGKGFACPSYSFDRNTDMDGLLTPVYTKRDEE